MLLRSRPDTVPALTSPAGQKFIGTVRTSTATRHRLPASAPTKLIFGDRRELASRHSLPRPAKSSLFYILCGKRIGEWGGWSLAMKKRSVMPNNQQQREQQKQTKQIIIGCMHFLLLFQRPARGRYRTGLSENIGRCAHPAKHLRNPFSFLLILFITLYCFISMIFQKIYKTATLSKYSLAAMVYRFAWKPVELSGRVQFPLAALFFVTRTSSILLC